MLLVSPTNRTIGLDFSEYDIETPNIYIDEDKGNMKYIEYYRRVLDCIR